MANPIRFHNIILTTSSQFTCAVQESREKRRMAGIAEKRVALVAKEVMQKSGYEDVKACHLEFMSRPFSSRDLFVIRTNMLFELEIA